MRKKLKSSIELAKIAEREKVVESVMALYYALKHIKGTPTLKDLVKLAKRIKGVYLHPTYKALPRGY